MATAVHASLTLTLDILYMVYYMERTKEGEEEKWTTVKTVGTVITIFTFCIVLSLLPLTCYHANLIRMNKTTNEELRGKYRKFGGSIFDRGCSENCRQFCFGGKSRVLRGHEEEYKEVEMSKLEPNIFPIHSMKDPEAAAKQI